MADGKAAVSGPGSPLQGRAKGVWPPQAIGQIPRMGHVSQTRAQGKAVSP